MAARSLPWAEKKKAQKTLGRKTVTAVENPANFSDSKTEGKSQKIN
jgi:hypothetical protein